MLFTIFAAWIALAAGAPVGKAAAVATPADGALAGRVMIDRDGDGKVSAGDEPAAGVVVAFEHDVFAVTDSDGRYRLKTDNRDGIVWVRTPSTCRPGPVFARVRNGAVRDLLLHPLTAQEMASPVRFAITTDTHIPTLNPHDIWDGGDVGNALMQAATSEPGLRFVATLGDVTQAGSAAQYAVLDRAITSSLDAMHMPWVPVVGNHDRTEAKTAYREDRGPEDYSFDVGKIHFLVWDTMADNGETLQFIQNDLALVDPSMTKIAFGHYSPDDAQAVMLSRAGIQYLFTGHVHASRRVERSGIIEWTSNPLTMGGLDLSPAGYRDVDIVDGVPHVTFHETMRVPVLAITSPSALGCLPTKGGAITIAAAGDPSAPVSLMLDGHSVPLVASGGWSRQGTTPPDFHSRAGHAIAAKLTMTPGVGPPITVSSTINTCDEAPTAAPTTGSWPQFGGGPEHRGERGEAIDGELREAWTTAVGGNILAGSPVIAGGIVVVAVTDLGGGDRGGVVALNLATGAIVWRVTTRFAVRNAAAIDYHDGHGTVVVPQSDGEVLALDLASGAERWRYDFRVGQTTEQATLWAAPAIADGVVYIGTQGKFAALQVKDGHVVWVVDPKFKDRPWLGAFSSAVIDGDLVIATLNRESGAIAFDKKTGAVKWQQAKAVLGQFCQPLVADHWIALPNASDQVRLINRDTGASKWVTQFDSRGFEWGHAITASAALRDQMLFVPTNYGEVVAVNLALDKQQVVWRAPGGLGPLALTHYRSYDDGFASAPVITGDRLWIGDTAGTLTAFSLDTGSVLDRVQLGVPILAGPAVVDSGLVVATYDGTVRLLTMKQTHRERARHAATWRRGRNIGLFVVAFGFIAWLVGRVRLRSRNVRTPAGH